MHIRNLSLIVAMNSQGVIGLDGKLPWDDIKDTKWFREKTLHQSLIMGRKTHDSIMARNGKPLDKRTSIVLSSRDWVETWPSPGTDPDGVRWARDPLEALDMAAWGWNGGGTYDAVVIGGAKVYEIFLPFVSTIHLTIVAGEHQGDTLFPGGVPGAPDWVPVSDLWNSTGFTCQTLVRAARTPG